MDKRYLEIQYPTWPTAREVLNIPIAQKFLDVYGFISLYIYSQIKYPCLLHFKVTFNFFQTGILSYTI